MSTSFVWETTNTTGVGPITLLGAKAGNPVQTFSANYQTLERFTYTIANATQFEIGLGYLSDSTTLVREKVFKSSNANALVNFAGASDVAITANGENVLHACPTTYSPAVLHPSAHYTYQQLSTTNIIADNQYFMPFYQDKTMQPTGIGFEVTIAGGTGANKARVGIYSVNKDGYPNKLLFESGDLSTNSTGDKKATLSGVTLKTGWYLVSLISDVAMTVRANNYTYQLEHILGWHNGRKTSYTQKGNSTWTNMLSDVDSWSAVVNNISPPMVGFFYD